jgi:hypothetical protein
MMFRKELGRANVLTLVERVSRFTLALRNRDRISKPIMESLVAGMAALPFDARRSITFDRGTEFTAWPQGWRACAQPPRQGRARQNCTRYLCRTPASSVQNLKSAMVRDSAAARLLPAAFNLGVMPCLEIFSLPPLSLSLRPRS